MRATGPPSAKYPTDCTRYTIEVPVMYFSIFLYVAGVTPAAVMSHAPDTVAGSAGARPGRAAMIASANSSVMFGTAISTSRGALFTLIRGTSSTACLTVVRSSRVANSAGFASIGENATTSGSSALAPAGRGRVMREYSRSATERIRLPPVNVVAIFAWTAALSSSAVAARTGFAFGWAPLMVMVMEPPPPLVTMAAVVDGKITDATRPLAALASARPIPLRLLTDRDPEALGVLRHSCAHVMARAVMRKFGGVQLAFGPTVDGGFYYDFSVPKPISEEDFPAIEAEMKKIVKRNSQFMRKDMTRAEAIAYFGSRGQSYKLELIESFTDDVIGSYDQGGFVDMCRGPHVMRTGQCKHFKLMKVAGAYWRGSEKGPMLQRVYGTAWESKAALDEHLHRLAEAELRDAVDTMTKHFGTRCLSPIRMATKVKEAPAQGRTIFEYASDSTAAEDYARTVDTLISAAPG